MRMLLTRLTSLAALLTALPAGAQLIGSAPAGPDNPTHG